MYEYKKGYWETKDHKIIKIKDMGISHIENTIKYLKRHTDFYDECYGNCCGDEADYWYMVYEDNSELVEKKIKELENELYNKQLEVAMEDILFD